MPAYRIALGSRLIIEEGTTASPNYSGLSFEVSGLSYQTLGAAVNASSTPITNLWSGVAFTDNRAQVFRGQNSFTQPVVAQQAVLPGQLATIGQVASYNALSGTGGVAGVTSIGGASGIISLSGLTMVGQTLTVISGGGPNVTSQLSGVQTLAINNQGRITILESEVGPLQSGQSGTTSTLGIIQNQVTVLSSNQSGIQSEVSATQISVTTLQSNYSGLTATEVNSQGRITVLSSNQSGIQNTLSSVQTLENTLVTNYSGLQIQGVSTQGRATVLTSNYSGLNNTVNALQAGGIGSTPLPLGLSLRVDSLYGNDTTALANITGGALSLSGNFTYPFKTVTGALSAAQSGTTIFVGPGNYSTPTSLAKNGVNWDFANGASVNKPICNDCVGIWDDYTSGLTFTVSGSGQFNANITAPGYLGTVRARNVNSNITINAEKISLSSINSPSTSFNQAVIYGDAGTIVVNATYLSNTISPSQLSSLVYWTNGFIFIQAQSISYAQWMLWSSVNNIPTGDCIINAQEISNLGDSIHTLAYCDGAGNNTAASWISANLMTGLVAWNGANKLYVSGQKLFGYINCSGGLVYLEVEKLAIPTGLTQPFFSITNGIVRVSTQQLDTTGAHASLSVIEGGTLRLNGSDFQAGTLDNGFFVTSGQLILRNCDFDLTANAGLEEIFTIIINTPPATGTWFQATSGTTYLIVWYNVDSGGGGPPSPPSGTFSPTFVEVDIASTDTPDSIATATIAAITGGLGWNVGSAGGQMSFQDTATGTRITPQDGEFAGATGFTFNTSQIGANPASAVIVSGGEANINNCKVFTASGGVDILQTAGILNVSGGYGSQPNGNYNYSGLVNFLTPN
jgi:hypothetical protein